MIKNMRSNNGQAIVEFALVLPLMVLFVLGIIEFGVLFYDKAMITNASREGARAAIVFQADSSGIFVPHNLSEIQTVVNNYLQTRLITFGSVVPVTTALTTTGTSPANGGNGQVDVRVTYTHTYLAFPQFTGWANTINIGAQTIMRIE